MPIKQLTHHKQLAPYHIDDLLVAANDVLRAAGLEEVQRRTLRFYILKGIVSRPIGSPKFARYEYGHLLRLVGARSAQDQGVKLDQIKELFDSAGKSESKLQVSVLEFLNRRPGRFGRLQVAEERGEATMKQIKLGKDLSLYIPKGASQKEELEKALAEIKKLPCQS